MKIAGVVILYYPDKGILENILSYAGMVDTLFVADNSENKNQAVAAQLETFPNLIYLHDGENKGIAYRLNQAAKLAISGGYDFLLTMDQDSFFEKSVAEQYLHCISQFKEAQEVAMFGVEFLSMGHSGKECKPLDVIELITSGSLLNLNLYLKTGGFDEALFIDLVDHEYCYRAILKGYKIIQFKNIFLHHQLGTSFMGRSIASFKVTNRTLHSPLRIYYMVRNYLYVKRKYGQNFKPVIDNQRKTIINRIKNNLIYGENKISNIKYIFQAIIDYRNGNMGKANKK